MSKAYIILTKHNGEIVQWRDSFLLDTEKLPNIGNEIKRRYPDIDLLQIIIDIKRIERRDHAIHLPLQA
ncbi:MAG: hypothetical protein ABIF11_11675 [Nitrospirota bacterium]